MLADVDLSDAVGGSDLDDLLDCDVVVVSAVAGNDEGLSDIVDLRSLLVEGIEDGLNEVLEVVRLGEDLDFLSEAASAWLLILVGFVDGDGLDFDLAGLDGGHGPLGGVHAKIFI